MDLRENSEEYLWPLTEVDEMYIGGRPRKNNSKWHNLTEPEKIPVITLIERPVKPDKGRGTPGRPGRVRSIVPEPDHKNRRLTRPKMTDLIEELIDQDTSEVHTDESPLYGELRERGWVHHSVLHRERYVAKDGHVHINTAESYHALPKRAFVGTYHKMGGPDYVRLYGEEFAWRWNRRREPKENNFRFIMELILERIDPPAPPPDENKESWPPPMGPVENGQLLMF